MNVETFEPVPRILSLLCNLDSVLGSDTLVYKSLEFSVVGGISCSKGLHLHLVPIQYDDKSLTYKSTFSSISHPFAEYELFSYFYLDYTSISKLVSIAFHIVFSLPNTKILFNPLSPSHFN